MQNYNQDFNKYARSYNLTGIKDFLGSFKSIAKLFPWLAAKASRVTRDANKVRDVAGKAMTNAKEFGKDVVDAASSPHMFWVAPAAYYGSTYIDKSIKDFANTYEGAKVIAEFNKEFEKATGHKPTTAETATYIANLQKRNQELETTTAGNKKPITESNSSPTPQADKFEIGKLFDISSPYAQYYTLPTAAGAALGGLIYGGKGSAIGGASGLGLGLLAKYIADSQGKSTANTSTASA